MLLASLSLIMKPRPKKLLDQVREVFRLKHDSYRTEESDVYWVRRYRRYILFHDKRHPEGMINSELVQKLKRC